MATLFGFQIQLKILLLKLTVIRESGWVIYALSDVRLGTQ